MAKFYFHLQGQVPGEDAAGMELPDTKAARQQAVRFASNMSKLNQALGGTRVDIVVTSEFGDELFTVSFPNSPSAAKPDASATVLDPEERYRREIRQAG